MTASTTTSSSSAAARAAFARAAFRTTRSESSDRRELPHRRHLRDPRRIPKKLLSYAAHYAEDFEDARGYGWSIEGASFSWPALIANKTREIARLSAGYTDGFARVGSP